VRARNTYWIRPKTKKDFFTTPRHEERERKKRGKREEKEKERKRRRKKEKEEEGDKKRKEMTLFVCSSKGERTAD
jgi:hypothetical protein